MATAVVDKKSSPAGAERAGWLAVHKPGEGTPTRLAMFAICAAFVLYSAHSWYYGWASIRDFLLKNMLEPISLGVVLNWATESAGKRVVSIAGTGLLLAGGLLLSYYYIYVKARTAEFLIQTDREMRNVTWPKVEPWFKPNTQVWGATYVVLTVVAALAVYIFAVDFVLNLFAQWVFYR